MGLFDLFSSDKAKAKEPVLKKEAIVLGAQANNREEALEMGGQILVEEGYVTKEYIEAMKERENEVSTYMGNGVAIPHGTSEAKDKIKKSGISVIQFPDGVDFGEGDIAQLVISIAGKGDEHLSILQNLATICQDEQETEELITAENKDIIYNKLLIEED